MVIEVNDMEEQKDIKTMTTLELEKLQLNAFKQRENANQVLQDSIKTIQLIEVELVERYKKETQ
jgi:hypothetical protein